MFLVGEATREKKIGAANGPSSRNTFETKLGCDPDLESRKLATLQPCVRDIARPQRPPSSVQAF